MERPKQKLNKYLTDLKELPTDTEEVKKVESIKAKPISLKMKQQISPQITDKSIEKPKNEENALPLAKKKAVDFVDSNKGRQLRPLFSSKDIVLGVINFASIILLIILLSKLPQKATEFKVLREQEIMNQTNPASEYAGLPEDQKKIDEMKALFLTENGIVDFVNQVEGLKPESPAIQKVTFASQRIVADKTGNYGVPVIIELSGNWSEIGSALERIQALRFLFRTVNLNIQHSKDDPNIVLFDYGVFLYVNDELGQN